MPHLPKSILILPLLVTLFLLGSCDVSEGNTVSDSLRVDSTLEAPRFSVDGGFDSVPHVVAIEAAESLVVFYTTDGSQPTKMSRLYRAPFLVESSMTVKAIAVRMASTVWFARDAGSRSSSVREAQFTIGKGATVFVDPRDDETYKTVKIGNQVWMAENLRYKKASSGCAWGDSTLDSCKMYGEIYTWSAVMGGNCNGALCEAGAQGVCPAGWHVPTHTEWAVLGSFVGMDSGGMQLKARTAWSNAGNGTDDYGFCALPNIWLGDNGLYTDAGIWWTSTGFVPHNPFSPFLIKTWIMRSGASIEYETPLGLVTPIFALDSNLAYGPNSQFPVRCLRD